MGAGLRQRRIGTVEALDMAIHGDVVDFTVEAEILGKINGGEERHRVVEAAKIVASETYCTIAVFRGATEVEAGEAGILRVVDTQVEVFQTASVGEFHVGVHLPGVEQEYSGFVFPTFGKLAAGVEVEELVVIETQTQRIGLYLVVILGRGCPVVDMFQVVEDGEVPIDNNASERAIRGFCIGKKNWQMIDTINGAHSSAIIYSIAETAKANNLKPYDYFVYLLEEIPKHMDDTDRSFLDDLLPWSDSIPDICKMKNKKEH